LCDRILIINNDLKTQENVLSEKTLLEKLRPSRGGALVVAGLIAFGAIILGGLYLSPAAKAPSPPADTPVGAPARKLRFVCYDLGRQHPESDPLFAAIGKLEPDYVFLQDIEEDDVIQAAELLEMQHTFHPQLYQRSEHLAGRRGTWGNLILSRQSLYSAAPIGGKRGGFGAWAVSVVDGKQFLVACMHFSPGELGAAEVAEWEQTRKERGSPPMVAAVIYSDPNPPGVMPHFSALDPLANGQWFYLTADWVVNGQMQAAGRGRAPVWIDATAAHIDNAATRPSAVSAGADWIGMASLPASASLASRINVSRR
jgi:endonuclease/exonuclease/phosphatase family metal-dependent hydrolase